MNQDRNYYLLIDPIYIYFCDLLFSQENTNSICTISFSYPKELHGALYILTEIKRFLKININDILHTYILKVETAEISIKGLCDSSQFSIPMQMLLKDT